MRKYQSKAKLIHEKDSILTSKQKYLISNHVASSIDDQNISPNADSTTIKNSQNLNNKKKRRESSKSLDTLNSVVLLRHSVIDDSLNQSQTSSDFFTNLNDIPSRTSIPCIDSNNRQKYERVVLKYLKNRPIQEEDGQNSNSLL
jgi:hypothetical protein